MSTKTFMLYTTNKMVSFLHLILPLFPFILFIIFFHGRRSPPPHKTPPPSPRKLPIIGNLHQLGTYPHRSLHSLSKHYGRLMLLHFGRVPVLVVSSADAACEIMKNQDLIFSNRPKLHIPNRLLYGSKDVAFTQYGEYWRQIRSICVLQLLSNKRVQSFCRVREEETSIMIDKIKQMGSLSSVINLSEVLISTTNNVVCRVALGRKYSDGGEGKMFKELLGEFVELLGSFSIGDYISWLSWIDRVSGLDARLERVAKMFDEFLEGVVEEHRCRRKDKMVCGDGGGEDQGFDFVDILLEFQRENEGTSPVEDSTIKAVVLVIIFSHFTLFLIIAYIYAQI
ncbi:hypothetical protein BUALT_Bualt07G0017200 [Buddleja alternifolia]|uniref:Uncharacterized protein n=1 Tax=Buddleja alternifolia TaxID=168488 RepID=A0AAV6X6J8_9LAMI|nr:hypothetical protein BUALT_Bualt07G0017200 [Buddleja alternifolia]